MTAKTAFRPTPLGLITAAVLAAGSAPALALNQDRLWSFAAGCSTRDFSSTCWRAGLLGAPGASAPGQFDNVYIVQDAATSLGVNFANDAATPMPFYNQVTLLGLGAGFAELTVARNELRALTIDLGAAFGLPGSASQTTRGRLRQTGGSIGIANLVVGSGANGAGEYLLSGGAVDGFRLSVGTGEAATGRVVQTGGSATFSQLVLGQAGFYEMRGGTLNLRENHEAQRSGDFLLSGGSVNTEGALRADTLQLAGHPGVLQTNFGADARLLQVGVAEGQSAGAVNMAGHSTVDRFEVGSGVGQASPAAVNLTVLGGTHRVAQSFALGGSANAWVLQGAVLDTQQLDIGSDGARNARLQVWGGQMEVRGDATVGLRNTRTAAELRVVEGGEARVQGDLFLKGDAALAVTGSGSRLSVAGWGVIGEANQPVRPSLSIVDGSVQFGELYIEGGAVSVTGADATLTASVLQARRDQAATLSVKDGARLEADLFNSSHLGATIGAGSEAQLGRLYGGAHIEVGGRVVVRGDASLDEGIPAFTGGGRVELQGDVNVYGVTLAEADVILSDGTHLGMRNWFSALEVDGLLHLDGVLELQTLGRSFAAGSVLDVLDWGSLSGQFDAFDFSQAPLAAGLVWDTSTFYTDGALRVAAAVPEPGTWALMLGGLALLSRRRLMKP
jgi:hypothetical protein